MTRFGFHIRTRSGQRIDNISILAATRDDAERRLRQMYRQCEVVQCSARVVRHPGDPERSWTTAARVDRAGSMPAITEVTGAPLREKAGAR
jgi:hypothetical protein